MSQILFQFQIALFQLLFKNVFGVLALNTVDPQTVGEKYLVQGTMEFSAAREGKVAEYVQQAVTWANYTAKVEQSRIFDPVNDEVFETVSDRYWMKATRVGNSPFWVHRPVHIDIEIIYSVKENGDLDEGKEAQVIFTLSQD